eukprot:CAMPEP_0171141260 /NCGR_PEP_ID=MMETSP0766_2-20121228/140333_1 /TAXON_ID=439317 /ORGANISM="Gambierdiscus australes, Strain CAWD 149" /LENGTH=739 /DNA_ID=CAMNT_0011604983 /DNA_START=84 /DNA_END=2303 /DNA_ORIENTATION=+
MGAIIGYSWVYGDSRRLTHGFDFRGRLCGVDPEVAHLKYLYYCGTQGAFEDEFPKKLNFDSKTCVERCPTDNNGSIDCLMHAFHNFTELPGSFQHNLTFVVTLNLEITQSVTKQMPYPTRPFRGKYCVPQWRENNTLMEDIMNGPLRRVSSLTVAAGSFRHAWPVVLGSAVLAVAMGIAYLHLLRSYAGPLIFASLCVGTVLFALLGLFFLLGILFNPWDQEGPYQHVNPLFRSFYGLEAKAYSVIVGVCFLAASVCLAFTTWQSTERIDESIGIIHAACDCIFAPGPGRLDLLLQPLVQGVVLLVFVVIVFLGFMLACSVGYIDDTGIIINDEKVRSLRKEFTFHWWWKPLLTFYMLAAFWVLEFVVAIGHFTVSYAVCLWYFTEIEEVDSEKGASRLYQDASTGHLKRIPKVRVHGVDSVPGGERAGFVEKGPRGDVLVVPIGKKGPYGMDFIEASHIDKKEMKCGATLQGFNVGLLFHTGSLALGAVIVTLTRPCRWVSHTIKGLLGKAEEQAQTFHEDRTPSNMALAGFSLLSTLLDGLFGGYSKNAYTEMVLSSSTFFSSAHDCLDFLNEVGGVVAFLHGSTALYEMIGVVCIAMICGGLAFCLLQISAFQDQNSGWFVSNPWMMTVLASGMASLISFSFMSLFNVTADTLLYVFAWSRKHHSKNIEKYCPHSLKQMVGQELVDVPEQSHLRARSKGGMKRLQHAAKRYAGTIMSTMKGQGAEQRPLLLQGGFR